jgi:glycosyltransferase involved in cell wall biosynthesis
MRVGFGVTVLARCLQHGGVDGIGSYTRELMKTFATNGGVDLIPFSFGSPLPTRYRSANDTLLFPTYPAVAMLPALSGLSFPGTSKLKGKVDLIHATDHLIPNFGKLPVVATLMDAIPLSHPEWMRMRFREIKTLFWRRSARWATHIITISEYSKREIATHFGIAEEKISVIPLGVDERWFRPTSREVAKQTLTKLDLPESFFLCVGTLQPRKNIARVIEAYRSLPQCVQSERPLVIVGQAGWGCEEMVSALASGNYGKSVRWLNYVADDDLLAIMGNAVALVFPSLYEGFGLPVLEAFAANVPVITSNGSALPEVAGDAAKLVDPLNSESIAHAMLELLENPALADRLRAKGRARALSYTWNQTTAMTLNVYRKVLKSCT